MKNIKLWIVLAAFISLGAGAALSHVIEPGVRVEKIMLTTNTPALRLFPATREAGRSEAVGITIDGVRGHAWLVCC